MGFQYIYSELLIRFTSVGRLLVKPLKVFRWCRWRWRVAGLLVSFTKCDISREQTAELMCDISPRGESQVQIASRLDINGDSSS